MKLRKILCLVFALLMVFALGACGDKGDNGSGSSDANEVTIGDFTAKFVSAELTKGSSDEDVIVVTYSFTNNGAEEEAFTYAFYPSFEQNGEVLMPATVFVNEESYETLDNSLQRVQPGETKDIVSTYALYDMDNDVVITMSDIDAQKEYTKTIKLADLK